MTGQGRGADSHIVGRTLCDIAQILESRQESKARVLGALELLEKLVPYQQCALLEAEPGCDPRLTTLPTLPAEEKDGLQVTLVKLFGQMLEERALAPETTRIPWGAHLAVPLIGLDEVIGVLFVRRAQGTYEKQHLRMLSLVAAQLAAYLMMLRARAEEMGRAQELQDARRSADFALRARDLLVTLTSRELETPRAAGMAWVRVLGSQSVSGSERARAVEIIGRGVRTRDRLVGDLLDLSSGTELRLELGNVDLAGSIAEALEALRPLAAQRTILLEAALDAAAGPVIADAARLDEVLALLLANAFDRTPDGGQIEVRLDPGAGGPRVQVRNSGQGFAPDRLPHVFDGLGAKGGPGVGLAIVKHVIELHGGNVRAESGGAGQGATFTLELPATAR